MVERVRQSAGLGGGQIQRPEKNTEEGSRSTSASTKPGAGRRGGAESRDGGGHQGKPTTQIPRANAGHVAPSNGANEEGVSNSAQTTSTGASTKGYRFTKLSECPDTLPLDS